MVKGDRTKFAALFRAVWATYTKERPDEIKPVMAVWFKTLGKYSIEQVAAGIERMFEKREFNSFPSPGELSKYIEAACGRLGSSEAWTLAVQAVKTGKRPDDAAVHKAIMTLGGYDYLGGLTVEKFMFLQKRFASAYQEISDNLDVRRLTVPDPPKALMDAMKLKDMMEDLYK